MAVRRYSKRTVESYLYWIKYFIIFHKKRHPSEMSGLEVEAFLTHIAVERKVAASTQIIALNSLAFLYNRFLKKPLGDLSGFRRSNKQHNRFPPTLCVTLSPPIYLSRELADFCSGTPDRCKIGIHYIHVDNIRTVQEQLGHHDVKTTEIYTHVLKRGARVFAAPLAICN
jgi:hypothetical protein